MNLVFARVIGVLFALGTVAVIIAVIRAFDAVAEKRQVARMRRDANEGERIVRVHESERIAYENQAIALARREPQTGMARRAMRYDLACLDDLDLDQIVPAITNPAKEH